LVTEEEIIMINKTRKTGKRLIAVLVATGIMSIGTVAFAAVASPAEIVSGLTKRAITEVQAERAKGQTYGSMAEEAGKLNEFKVATLDSKKAWLDEQVAAKKMTQEEADKIYNDIKEAQLTCDGDGSAQIGKENGANFGGGMGSGTGLKDGSGAGGKFGRNATGTTAGTARGAGAGGRGMNR